MGIVVKEESVRFVHGVRKDRRFGVAILQFAIAASWCVVAVVWEESVVVVVVLPLHRVEVTGRHRCCAMVFGSICLIVSGGGSGSWVMWFCC